MPRTKKVVTEQTQALNTITTTEANLSIKEVWDVLEFSRNLISGIYPGVFTPDLISSRLKDISYSPASLTDEELSTALANPKDNEEKLRSIVEYIELISAPFRRVLAYMASQLSLDVTYTVGNIENPSEYTSKSFKRDQKVVFDWLDRFNYKYHFRNAIKQLLRNELYVCCVRDEGKEIVLQELPLQYIKLTGKWDYGYLVSMNFMYFLQPSVDINLYPKFFKQKFGELFKDVDIQKYNPHLSPELRGNSQYVYWVDLPPQVAFAFKLDPSLATAVPMYASFVPEVINQPTIRALQKNINMASASKILVGQVPMLKDTKAKVSDMIAIDPTTLGKFLALVKSALGDVVKVTSAPLENITAIDFEGDNEVYSKYLKSAVSASGVNSSLIYSGELKANAIESQLSMESDSLIMEQSLYPQFSAFMDYYVNRETRKYKYFFEFEGNAYYLNRKQRFEDAMTLANVGIVLPQKIAAAQGMKPQTLIRMLEESKAMNFTDMLTPIISAFQQSGNPNAQKTSAGRPAKSDSELGDEGVETRTSGTNVSRGGDQ